MLIRLKSDWLLKSVREMGYRNWKKWTKQRAISQKLEVRIRRLPVEQYKLFTDTMAKGRFGRKNSSGRKEKKKGRSRSRRCEACANCLKPNCQDCTYCKDMPKYGGQGSMKQVCIQRRCLAITCKRLEPEVTEAPVEKRAVAKSCREQAKDLEKYRDGLQ